MLKAIFFDLDDTLLWDSKSVDKALQATCYLANRKYQIDLNLLKKNIIESSENIYKTYGIYEFAKRIEITAIESLWGGINDEGEEFKKLKDILKDFREKVWKKGLERVGIIDDDLATQMSVTFPKKRREYIYLYDDTLEVLNTLKDEYILVLITNGSPDLQKEKLNMSPELKRYFDYVAISGDYGFGKPHSRMFEHIINIFSLKRKNILMVGDNLYTDILGAENSNIKSAWINHYGYTGDAIKPTYEVTNLKEILSILTEFKK